MGLKCAKYFTQNRVISIGFDSFFIAKKKKNTKKAKKMQNNLHISKICCTFAPDLKTKRDGNS